MVRPSSAGKLEGMDVSTSLNLSDYGLVHMVSWSLGPHGALVQCRLAELGRNTRENESVYTDSSVQGDRKTFLWAQPAARGQQNRAPY